jgi:hypothetical protein
MLPEAAWGRIKVGARTPPVRVREGWLAIIDGVDELEHPSGAALMRYCAGVIIQGAERLDRVISARRPRFVPRDCRRGPRYRQGTSFSPPQSMPEANAPSISTSEWQIVKSAAVV